MHHFFIPAEMIKKEMVTFPSEIADQIRKVLRLRDGEQVIVLDNSGVGFRVEISYAVEGVPHGNIIETVQFADQNPVPITLYLPLTKRDKFEWMLQKCVEAGADTFIPFISSRSLVQDRKEIDSKRQRWEKIIQEAAEQSKRSILPVLMDPIRFKNAITQPVAYSSKLIFWEDELTGALSAAMPKLDKERQQAIALMVGPEGGFSTEEVEQARAAGWKSVTLGKRILRMETAAIAATLLTSYEIEKKMNGEEHAAHVTRLIKGKKCI